MSDEYLPGIQHGFSCYKTWGRKCDACVSDETVDNAKSGLIGTAARGTNPYNENRSLYILYVSVSRLKTRHCVRFVSKNYNLSQGESCKYQISTFSYTQHQVKDVKVSCRMLVDKRYSYNGIV